MGCGRVVTSPERQGLPDVELAPHPHDDPAGAAHSVHADTPAVEKCPKGQLCASGQWRSKLTVSIKGLCARTAWRLR